MHHQEFNSPITEVQKLTKTERKDVKLAVYRLSETHTRARIYVGEDIVYERVARGGSDQPALHVVIAGRLTDACYPLVGKTEGFPAHTLCSKIRQMFLSCEDEETPIDAKLACRALIFT